MDGLLDRTLGSDPVHQDRPHHGVRLIDLSRCCPGSEADCKNDTVRYEARRLGRASVYRGVVGFLKAKIVMERVFIGATRAEATRMADEWWGRQKGLRQTLRTEMAVGGEGPDAQLDQWAITIRYEDANSGSGQSRNGQSRPNATLAYRVSATRIQLRS
jgi:hypothetical protein